MGGGSEGWGFDRVVRRVGAQPRKSGGLKGGGPKMLAALFSNCPRRKIRSFLPSLGVFSWNEWWMSREATGALKCVCLEFSGCRVRALSNSKPGPHLSGPHPTGPHPTGPHPGGCPPCGRGPPFGTQPGRGVWIPERSRPHSPSGPHFLALPLPLPLLTLENAQN